MTAHVPGTDAPEGFSVAPSRGSFRFFSWFLELTPQAMDLSPLRGFVYLSTVSFGAVSFVKTE